MNALTARCPIRTTLEMLGGKWRLLIIHQLGEESLRFSELRRRLPDISEKMLTQELRILADNDLVERINHGTVPPHVEYRLTERGRLALPLIGHLAAFGMAYLGNEQVEENRLK